MYEIRIAGAEVQFLVAGRVQHRWDESDRKGNMQAAQAYLRAVGAVAVQVSCDGVSGWWQIETGDEQAHIEDDLRASNFKI